jgi:hypothetical protein
MRCKSLHCHYYADLNHIKTHEGLEGKTPAEACGIELMGENKWLTLIQNASVKVKIT